MRKETIDLILKNRKKHEGNSDSELLDFAITQIQNEITDQTTQAGQQILDGIRTLERLKSWPSLLDLSKHALMCVIEIIEKEDYSSILKSFQNTLQFKKAILDMSKFECIAVLNEDAKQKYFKKEMEKCQEKTQTN